MGCENVCVCVRAIPLGADELVFTGVGSPSSSTGVRIRRQFMSSTRSLTVAGFFKLERSAELVRMLRMEGGGLAAHHGVNGL